MNRSLREATREARIPVHYADELSKAARMFGASTKREARTRPGGFERPVVGRDSDYYARAAAKVVRHAIKADQELKGLYLHAWSLSSDLERVTRSPYDIAGPQVETAQDLTDTTIEIQHRLLAKDLRLPLQGKRLDRAVEISAFAIRVITGSGIGGLFMDENNRGLYPGLPPDLPVNTEEYWSTLHEQLITPINSLSP